MLSDSKISTYWKEAGNYKGERKKENVNHLRFGLCNAVFFFLTYKCT